MTALEEIIKDRKDRLNNLANQQALEILEKMPATEFNEFLNRLPDRVQLMIKANFVDWREVLPEWYVELNTE